MLSAWKATELKWQVNLVIQDDVLGSTAASSFGGFRGGTAANLRKALFVQHLGLEKETLDEGFDNLKKDWDEIWWKSEFAKWMLPWPSGSAKCTYSAFAALLFTRPRQTPAFAARTGKCFLETCIAASYTFTRNSPCWTHMIRTRVRIVLLLL